MAVVPNLLLIGVLVPLWLQIVCLKCVRVVLPSSVRLRVRVVKVKPNEQCLVGGRLTIVPLRFGEMNRLLVRVVYGSLVGG